MKTSLLRINLLRGLALLGLATVAISASAQTSFNPPSVMSYQGYLTDQAGNPLGATNTGPKNYNVIFRVWNTQTGGTPGGSGEVYAEQQTVTVTAGYFSVLLGLGSAYSAEPHASQISSVFPATLSTPLYVEITVLGIGPSGGNITILPRLQLVSSPYSFLAANSLNAANLVGTNNTSLIRANGNTVAVTAPLTISGAVTASSATVSGPLSSGALTASSATVSGSLVANGGLTASSATVSGALSSGALTASSATVSGSLAANGGLTASSATVSGALSSGALTASSATVSGALSSGALTASSATVSGSLAANGGLTASSATVSGALAANGGLTASSATVNGALSSGALTASSANVGGSLTVNGSSTLVGNITANNNLNINGDTHAVGTIYATTYGILFPQSTTINNNGYIGIGTTTPQFPLTVMATVNSGGGPNSIWASYLNKGFFYLNNGNPTSGSVSANFSSNVNYSVYIAGRSAFKDEIDVFSDARIKQIIDRSDSAQDLALVRQLKITDYHKIDRVSYGDTAYKGVIAQEVEKVIPEAVSRTTDFIPDIYAVATDNTYDASHHVLRVTLAKDYGLQISNVVRLITSDGIKESVVLSVPATNVFDVSLGKNIAGKVFVYGKQMSDVRVVSYDRLFTTGLGAIQELAKRTDQLSAQQMRLSELEKKAAQVDALEQELADLKKVVAQLAESGKASGLATGTTPSPKLLTTASLAR